MNLGFWKVSRPQRPPGEPDDSPASLQASWLLSASITAPLLALCSGASRPKVLCPPQGALPCPSLLSPLLTLTVRALHHLQARPVPHLLPLPSMLTVLRPSPYPAAPPPNPPHGLLLWELSGWLSESPQTRFLVPSSARILSTIPTWFSPPASTPLSWRHSPPSSLGRGRSWSLLFANYSSLLHTHPLPPPPGALNGSLHLQCHRGQ